MTVTYGHIQAAEAILNRIAFARGEGADPAETLAIWRRAEGFEDGALERAAAESATGTLAEITQMVEDGETMTDDLFWRFVEREYLTALQIGWIIHARQDAAAKADEAKVKDAAREG